MIRPSIWPIQPPHCALWQLGGWQVLGHQAFVPFWSRLFATIQKDHEPPRSRSDVIIWFFISHPRLHCCPSVAKQFTPLGSGRVELKTSRTKLQTVRCNTNAAAATATMNLQVNFVANKRLNLSHSQSLMYYDAISRLASYGGVHGWHVVLDCIHVIIYFLPHCCLMLFGFGWPASWLHQQSQPDTSSPSFFLGSETVKDPNYSLCKNCKSGSMRFGWLGFGPHE